MSSDRHCTSTWMVTSSGTRSSSTRTRTKSKSGWDADGKPTSISLNPICTSVANMRRFRSMSIGSIRAWLPSRRSTAHHLGARVMVADGQVRSASGTGWYGRYSSNGIFFGCTGWGGIGAVLGRVESGKQKTPRPEGAGGRGEHPEGCPLAEKEEAQVRTHQGDRPTRLRSGKSDLDLSVQFGECLLEAALAGL